MVLSGRNTTRSFIHTLSYMFYKIFINPSHFYTAAKIKFIKVDRTPKQLNWADKLIWYLFPVLNNTPKWKKPQSLNFLTTSTCIQRKSFAVPSAYWTTISKRAVNNIKRGAAHYFSQCNTVLFAQVNLILLSQQAILPPSFSAVCWLLTLITWGYV